MKENKVNMKWGKMLEWALPKYILNIPEYLLLFSCQENFNVFENLISRQVHTVTQQKWVSFVFFQGFKNSMTVWVLGR
jgi:hypothetical protein